MSKNLFSDFEEVSAKQWKQKIQYDLKGADYNDHLIWNSPDGINVKPFYHPDEVSETAEVNIPGGWTITQQIYVTSEERANKKALDALKRGAESIWFVLPSETIDLSELLKGIDTFKTPIYLKLNSFSERIVQGLKDYDQKDAKIFLQVDVIGNLARSGNWFKNKDQDYRLMNIFLEEGKNFASVISVDGSLYQNSGATIPQQLAYCMAHLNEYFNHFMETGKVPKNAGIQFIMAVGSNYFFEIAKLRALRMLFETLISEYGFDLTCHILAIPTRRNKTLYDYNVNLLRTTTECMSAILGGANAMCNMPYDAIYHKNNSFGSRIARNQLLVLKHESYFEKAANPAQGSYYIESLTQEIAEKALEIFKTIEKGGGFLTQLKEGIIQKKIEQSALKEQEEFNKGELVLIGTNKYPNPQDKMKEELELYPFVKQNPRKTLIQPIIEKRLAEASEKQRLDQEQN